MVRPIELKEIDLPLFDGFHRHQVVTRCWRKRDGQWIVIDHPFVEEWSKADYAYLMDCLRETLAGGGVVFGDFDGDRLRGFAAVVRDFFGSRNQYLELASLHVSEEHRGHGIGRALMTACREWAGEQGAEMLYISAHSAVESQAFYKAVGCREAAEYRPESVAKEPCDCQLEIDVL